MQLGGVLALPKLKYPALQVQADKEDCPLCDCEPSGHAVGVETLKRHTELKGHNVQFPMEYW